MCYGVGVTVGAGIYVLVGAAGLRAGVHAPLAFLIAAGVMAFTAASFAELAGRYPVSAGEAAYVQAGLGTRWAALATGILVVVAGVVSAAAISRGAAGYLSVLLPVSQPVLVAAVVLVMGGVAIWGIREAVGIAAIMTLIEIGGLLTVIFAGLWQHPEMLADLPLAVSDLGASGTWQGILGATMIAFFAFIGFEGMVNVIEEVRRPERTMPLAIAITLVVSTLLYVLVVWVVLRTLSDADLAASSAPLSLAFQRLTGASPAILATIGVIATVNGVIVQMVMSSRVLYGLSNQGVLPKVLGRVNRFTHTPMIATICVILVVLVLALAVPIDRLADMTSRVMLVIFSAVNVSLLAIKLRETEPPASLTVPIGVPIIGVLTCLGLLFMDLLFG